MSSPDFSPGLYQFCRRTLKAGLLLYNRLEVHGSEHIPATGGCIIAANHVSFLDPPIIGAAVRGRVVRFVARDTLFRYDWSRRFFLAVAAVPLARERGDLGALKKAIQILKAGNLVGLFPEGTRSANGELQEVKGGIGFIIAKAGVPVVPAYIQGSFEALSRHARFIKPTKIRVFIGPPITPAEVVALGEGRDVYERTSKLVMDRILSLRPAA